MPLLLLLLLKGKKKRPSNSSIQISHIKTSIYYIRIRFVMLFPLFLGLFLETFQIWFGRINIANPPFL